MKNVANSINIPLEAVAERVFTAEDLCKMFNVSRKTITRWRQRGLVGRRFVSAGRTRLGFLQGTVERFVNRNADLVARSSRFRRLTATERGEIVERARHLMQLGLTPAEVTKQLVVDTGRSAETIRCTVRDFDKHNPAQAVLANSGALDARAKETIFRSYCGGTPIRSLARRFRRSEHAIRRVIAQLRYERILALPLDYMPSPDFDQPGAEQTILGPLPESPIARRNVRGLTGLPSYLASLYDVPLLTAKQEVYLFRKYNFLKFRAAGLRSQLDPQRKQNRVLDQIERLFEEAVATKNQIIQANLRLVVSMVKRYVSDTEQLFDLVSEGNESLMRAVEKFDYTRGFKFSTYASWAIKKNYARSYAKEMKQRDRFRSGSEELFDGQPEHRDNPYEQLRAQEVRENQVGKILECLPDRERQIIVERFGLTPDASPKTLQVIANELGVSKERIRQLERRAMSKLREAAREENVELSEAA
jgi:RNA polymerase primary sigma factor/RNA polymerase sigma factor